MNNSPNNLLLHPNLIKNINDKKNCSLENEEISTSINTSIENNAKLFISDDISSFISKTTELKVGTIKFRFYFLNQCEKKLYQHHFDILNIIKNFLNNFISSHRFFYNQKYYIDINIAIKQKENKIIGEALLKDVIVNYDKKYFLPISSYLYINEKYIKPNKNAPENLTLAQTILHELIHCMGFGYFQCAKNNSTINIDVSNDQCALLCSDRLKNIFYDTYNIITNGIPLDKKLGHFNYFNNIVLKNNEPFSIIPGIHYELMNTSDNEYNCLTIFTATVLYELGYEINFSLIDKIPLNHLPFDSNIFVCKMDVNHFLYNNILYPTDHSIIIYTCDLLEKIELYHDYKNLKIFKNCVYTLQFDINSNIKIIENLNDNIYEKCLTNDHGIFEEPGKIVIIPNDKTPKLFFIVSEKTLAGIPLFYNPSKEYNEQNEQNDYYNDKSVTKLCKEYFIS